MSAYEIRVRELEAEGLTRSDAQAVVDAEELNNKKEYEDWYCMYCGVVGCTELH